MRALNLSQISGEKIVNFVTQSSFWREAGKVVTVLRDTSVVLFTKMANVFTSTVKDVWKVAGQHPREISIATGGAAIVGIALSILFLSKSGCAQKAETTEEATNTTTTEETTEEAAG